MSRTIAFTLVLLALALPLWAQSQSPVGVQWDRATEQIHNKQLDAALKTAQEAIRVAPHSADAWMIAGYVRQAQEEFILALRMFMKAVRLAPKRAMPLVDLAWTYAMFGEYAQAEIEARKAVKLEPEMAVAWRTLATAQWHLGKLKEAEANFRIALRLEPYNGRYRSFYAGVLSEMGREEEAQRQYRMGLTDLCDHTGEAYYTLAWSLQNTNELRASAEAAQRSAEVAQAPDIKAEGLNALGYARMYLGDYAAARTAVDEAVKLQPDNPYFLDSVAVIALLQGDLATADKYLTLAMSQKKAETYVNPTQPLLWARQGKRAEAVAQAKRVEQEIAETGGAVDDYYLVGQAYAELGEKSDARRLFQRGARLFPRHPWGLKMQEWLAANPE